MKLIRHIAKRNRFIQTLHESVNEWISEVQSEAGADDSHTLEEWFRLGSFEDVLELAVVALDAKHKTWKENKPKDDNWAKSKFVKQPGGLMETV